MIFNIGVDIEKISRFKVRNKSILRKILTEGEIAKIKEYSPQRIAGIFSAKEAVIKACNPIKKLYFNDIEVLHNKNGSPYIKLKKFKEISSKCIKISISHSEGDVVSTAILLIED